MQLIANDTLRVTAATPSRLLAGDCFDINDGDGAALVRRGLARLPDQEPASAGKKPTRARKAPAKEGQD